MIQKGIDFVVKNGENLIGGQRGASLKMAQDLVEITTKDSGGFRESEPSFKSWAISADGLMVDGDAQWSALVTAYLGGTKLNVDFSYTGGSVDMYSGEVFVASLTVDAPYDDEATYTVEFTGTGAITRATSE